MPVGPPLHAWLLVAALAAAAGVRAAAPGSLDRELLGERAGMLLAMDADTGRLLLRLDRRSHRGPLPVGSLVKPFTLLAGRKRLVGRAGPVVHCPPGGPPTCWYPPGHGNLGPVGALAQSCNVWFRRLAREVDPQRFREVLVDHGLPPPVGDPVACMVGTESSHRIEPARLLVAFSAALGGQGRFRSHPRQPVYLGVPPAPRPVVELLRRGLAASGREGTGRHAGELFGRHRLLCKTGTAARVDAAGRRDPLATSGWFVGLLEDVRPRRVVLAMVERGTGSRDASPLGARLLARLAR